MLRRTLRILLRVLLAVLAFVGLYLLAAFVLSRIPVDADPQTDRSVTVYLRTNGVHTDLVLPVRNELMDWAPFVPAAHTVNKDTSLAWVAFGWGDKGFYMEVPTWDDLTARVALRAAFGLSGSAMHVTRHGTLTEDEQCRQFTMDRTQYMQLVQSIRSGFLLGNDGLPQVIRTDAMYGKDDAFYEGTGRYSVFHTCNTWTNSTLKACGQKASVWTPFASGVMRWYE